MMMLKKARMKMKTASKKHNVLYILERIPIFHISHMSSIQVTSKPSQVKAKCLLKKSHHHAHSCQLQANKYTLNV